jgi:hypothetical protein
LAWHLEQFGLGSAWFLPPGMFSAYVSGDIKVETLRDTGKAQSLAI